jgi:hypothetical protein
VLALTAATVGLVGPVDRAGAATSTAACDPARPSVAAFYGPSAGVVYDRTFTRSVSIPNVAADWTPQGMTSWQHNGQDLIIIGEFKKGQRSRLVAQDPRTGRIYGTALVAEAHLGGIAIVGNWLFAQDEENATGESVRKYRLSTLAAAFDTSHRSGNVTKPYVGRNGALQPVYFASFMTADGNTLWAGHHGVDSSKMYQYRVAADGTLTRVGGAYQVPQYTDGLVVSADRFIFISHAPPTAKKGFGTMTVAARATKLTNQRCFAMPNLGEGAVLVSGNVYTVFESGTPHSHPTSADVIPYLHRASYAALAALVP